MATKEAKLLEGRRALQMFFNASLKYSGSELAKMTYQTFELKFDAIPHITPWREHLGDTILWSQYPSSRVKVAMENMANQFQGRVPSTPKEANAFVGALADDSVSIGRQLDLVGDAVVQTVDDVKSVAIAGLSLYTIGAGIAGVVLLSQVLKSARS